MFSLIKVAIFVVIMSSAQWKLRRTRSRVKMAAAAAVNARCKRVWYEDPGDPVNSSGYTSVFPREELPPLLQEWGASYEGVKDVLSRDEIFYGLIIGWGDGFAPYDIQVILRTLVAEGRARVPQ